MCVFYRFTSVCMCASLSSSHPSICADDEQGSIFRKRVMKYIPPLPFYNQTRLFKRKESYTEVYSSSTCLDPSTFPFLPNTWDGEELGALLQPADRILLFLLPLTASSGSPESLLRPPPSFLLFLFSKCCRLTRTKPFVHSEM